MGIQVEDGRGRGNIAAVSADNRLDTSSRQNKRAYYISRDDGQSYSVTSNVAASSLGSMMMYFQNTSTTRNFFLDQISFGSGTNAKFRVHFVTGTAAGGTALTPVNLNRTSSNSAEATVRGDGDITGLTTAATLGTWRVSANDFDDESYDDVVILGQDDAVAVEYDSGGLLTSEVVLRGFFE